MGFLNWCQLTMGERGRNMAKPWQEVEIPENILTIPGMLAQEEAQYYIWLTESVYEGHGAIVDLGAWLGLSAACLATGLDRGQKKGKIFSFDRFEWDTDYMSPIYDGKLEDGEDFLPAFRQLTALWAHRIEVEKQDLLQYQWNRGPIELLVVDAAKTWELTNSILRGFGPALIPEKSRVLFQDFNYEYCHWLPLLIDSRPDLWEEAEATDGGWTATFRPRRELFTLGGIEENYQENSFSFDQAAKIFQARITRASPFVRRSLRCGLLRKALIEGEPAANVLRDELLGDYEIPLGADKLMQVQDVAKQVITPAWIALKDGDLDKVERLVNGVLSNNPADPELLFILAKATMQGGNALRAQALAEDILGLDAQHIGARLLQVELALQAGLVGSEEQTLSEIRQIVGMDTLGMEYQKQIDTLLTSIAWIALKNGDLDKVERLVNGVLSNNPAHPELLFILAKAEMQAGNDIRAQALAEDILGLDAQHIGARLLQVELALQAGLVGSEEQTLSEIRKDCVADAKGMEYQKNIDSLSASLQIHLGWPALWSQDDHEAESRALMALAFEPKNYWAWQLLAMVGLERMDLKLTKHAVSEGLAIHPEDPFLRLLKLDLDRICGQLSHFEDEVLAIFHETPSPKEHVVNHGLKILVEYWVATLHFEHGEEVLQKIVNRWPWNAEACLWLAKLRKYHLDDQDGARQACSMALSRRSDHPYRNQLQLEFNV